jgi:hypothetical protein
MTSSWKALYVWTNLRHDDLGGAAADAGDRVQVVQCDLKRALTLGDLNTQPLNRLVQEVDRVRISATRKR